jgi:hypothetical protein
MPRLKREHRELSPRPKASFAAREASDRAWSGTQVASYLPLRCIRADTGERWIDGLRRYPIAIFTEALRATSKGAKPSDLAVRQPTKFQLVINLRTGKIPWSYNPTITARAR